MGFPFLWMIIGSLMSHKQIYNIPPDWIPRPFEFSNYLEAIKLITWRPFFNTFVFTVGVTVGLIFLCLLSAFAFAKLKLPGKNILFMIYLSSIMIPWIVTFIPQFVIVSKFNWADTFMGLIFPYFGAIAVGTFFFRQFFMSVPEDIFSAAKIDGCNYLQVLLRVYIPMSKGPIMAFTVLTVLNVWNMYVWPLVVTTSKSMRVLTLSLASLTETYAAIPTGVVMAANFLSMVPMLIIYIFAQRWFIEGIATTGLKY